MSSSVPTIVNALGLADDLIPLIQGFIFQFDSRAVIKAARTGRGDIVTTALGKGVDPNAVGERGWTALTYATVAGHVDVMQILLDDDRTDPIFFGGHADVMHIVYGDHYHTDPNFVAQGWTALHHAAYYNRVLAATALLADPRTDPNLVDYHGNSALLIAVYIWMVNSSADVLENLYLVRIFLADDRVDSDIENYIGDTVLGLALSTGVEWTDFLGGRSGGS
jgi:hypothetical protein